jgi:hypothetical protein
MTNHLEGMTTMTVSLTKALPPRRFLSMANRIPNGEPINDAIARMQASHIELNFAITPEDHAEYETCEGHESTSGPIGNVIYCDGTCCPNWTPLIRI